MSEIFTCQKNPGLLCIRGVCPNHPAVEQITTPVDAVTIKLIHEAQDKGLRTENEIARYVSSQESYLRIARESQTALDNLPSDQCAPLSSVPSVS